MSENCSVREIGQHTVFKVFAKIQLLCFNEIANLKKKTVVQLKLNNNQIASSKDIGH